MPVRRALPGHEVMMGDTPIKQPIPTASVEQIGPFLLLHHHAGEVKAGSDRWNTGVGPHPHRGFSPVTFIYQGGVHHRDSRGNNSVVHEGGVQWMDVGMGIVHSERPPAELCEHGGIQEIIQLWVNLPAALKMIQPAYIPLQKDEMPSVQGHPELRIVSGTPVSGAAQGPLKSAYPIDALHGTTSTAPLTFEVHEGQNGFIYLLSGGGRIAGYGLVEEHTLYELTPGSYTFEPAAASKILCVSAVPIQEKVESYGPFVMNNQTQIMEAMRDYQMGKMGMLVERDLD
ncbi:MAG: Putative quercetin 2,3-dioxygenase [Cryomorphaceae bacterium]|nr:MAG: Putative quercetin 2,3-dioxygenase [Cryomorphaceae bacterium]